MLLIIVNLFAQFQVKRIGDYYKISLIREQGINYDAFRRLKVTKKQYADILKQGERISDYGEIQDTELLYYMNEIGVMTYYMLKNDFNLTKYSLQKTKNVYQGIIRMAKLSVFYEMYFYYASIFRDVKYFPVPDMEDKTAYVTYEDSWFYKRTYGGDRKHEGTDLMASNKVSGYFPVISMTSGVVERKGWLPQGGYRLGIRSRNGGYFYYAHLDSYAPKLTIGDFVQAGDLLGFMGNSGYGEEGTTGMFDPHLHLGIYVSSQKGELSVNPYHVLKIIEDK